MSPPIYWTKQRCLDAIRKWALEHGGLPPRREDWKHAAVDHPCANTLDKRFGTWTFALQLAGYQPRRGQPFWTRRRIIASLTYWKSVHGEPPRQAEWANATPEHPAHSTVQRVFGTWNTALAAAGMTTRRGPQKWTRPQIVKAIRRHVATHGHTPSSTEWLYAAPGRPNVFNVRRMFGTWNNAIALAGYDTRVPGERRAA